MVSGPAAETARGQERNQGGLPGGRAVGGDAAVHRSATPAPREVGISSPPSARAPGPLEDPGGTRHTHRGPRLRGRRSPAGSAAPRAAAAGRTGTAREGPRGEARGRPGRHKRHLRLGCEARRSRARGHQAAQMRRRRAARRRGPGAGAGAASRSLAGWPPRPRRGPRQVRGSGAALRSSARHGVRGAQRSERTPRGSPARAGPAPARSHAPEPQNQGYTAPARR